MGCQHGEACADVIRAFYDAALDQVAARLRMGTASVEKSMELWMAPMVESVERRFPHLLEEVRGLAEGAGLSFVQAFFLQVRFEMLHAATWRPECTTVGVGPERARGGAPLVAQNIDLALKDRRFMTLLHLKPANGPRILMCTHGGVIGEPGINSYGLAAFGNLVVSDGWGRGCPSRAFLRRAILEQRSVRDALALIERCKPRASGHSLMLADASGVVANVETTPDAEAVTFVAPAEARAHTNHYLTPAFASRDRYEDPEGSRRRLARIEELLRSVQPVGPDDLIRMLSDHEAAICRHARTPEDVNTVACIVGDPASGTLWVCSGNPCASPARPINV